MCFLNLLKELVLCNAICWFVMPLLYKGGYDVTENQFLLQSIQNKIKGSSALATTSTALPSK